MKEYSIIGKPTPNVDGPAKVSGEAQYTIDMTLPNMLYGRILRSPYPHARILSIDTSAAERLIGVKAVVTGKDTLGKKMGIWRRFPELCDEEILCREKARYIGDPVAAVGQPGGVLEQRPALGPHRGDPAELAFLGSAIEPCRQICLVQSGQPTFPVRLRPVAGRRWGRASLR